VSSCDATSIMAVGTFAHETGHAFGIPDLYDTDPGDGDDSEGIGEWGLMSSGNYRTAASPAHMEGFSRLTLGWVTVRDLAASGTYAVGPYNVGDTIFRIVPTVANPRGEYYLVENRQRTLSDTALTRAPSRGPGLLIFHYDDTKYNAGRFSNSVNSGTIHGLRLEQADGAGNLDIDFGTGSSNRGDAGDPYPGSSGNTAFGVGTAPAARMNAGNAFPGFAIDSIRQVVVNGEMAFRLRFGFPVAFSTAGAGTVSASPVTPSGTFLTAGDSVTLTAAATGAQSFVGWSGDTTTTNASLKLRATRAWTVVANFAAPLAVSDTVLSTAVMGTAYIDTVRVNGGSGTYVFTLLTGSLPSGLSMSGGGIITGMPDRDSTYNFTVRVTSGPQVMDLPLRLQVTAPTLAVANVVAHLLGTGTPLAANEISYLDLLGNHNNSLDVGDFVAWLDRTGTAVSAATMQRVMMRGVR
jgi:hypothetical protein